MQSLWDMEKFSVDWDHRPQIFQIRTKYWDFSEMREIDRTFNFSNYSIMPFFLLLSKFSSSAALSAVGGDIWTRLLYHHFFQSQLIIRTVSYVKFIPESNPTVTWLLSNILFKTPAKLGVGESNIVQSFWTGKIAEYLQFNGGVAIFLTFSFEPDPCPNCRSKSIIHL